MIKEFIVSQIREDIDIVAGVHFQQAIDGYDGQGIARVYDRYRGETKEIERLHYTEIETVIIYFPSGSPNQVGKIELQAEAIIKAAEAIKLRTNQSVWLTAGEKGVDEYFSTLDSE